MPGFEVWDVVKVPFPYTDRPVREWRPALVVAAGDLLDRHGLLWVMMITSMRNRGWPGDVGVTDLKRAGLPAPSVVRTAKVATIEAGEASRLGGLSVPDRRAVSAAFARLVASALPPG